MVNYSAGKMGYEVGTMPYAGLEEMQTGIYSILELAVENCPPPAE